MYVVLYNKVNFLVDTQIYRCVNMGADMRYNCFDIKFMNIFVPTCLIGRCQNYDCDLWNAYQLDCTTLEVVYGCKCGGCFCHHRTCETSKDCFPVGGVTACVSSR